MLFDELLVPELVDKYYIFAIAIRKNAPNPEMAWVFLDLILSKTSRQLLEDCGLIPY
ncbi:hypothetical protein P378_03770 [Desulforamulus profundi]|uniref:Uncharacterized protein n=1 Tax=Desulforamulus profundi TaxID=1383067 RepID=A0A2C6MII7_9FIRM|nr:hypothetical protein [Desulforamulus profundi]PHJ39343.1 hypothetical protein P378_03770 [Desulforamulus profundi]